MNKKRTLRRSTKKYRQIAAGIAGAAIMSTALFSPLASAATPAPAAVAAKTVNKKQIAPKQVKTAKKSTASAKSNQTKSEVSPQARAARDKALQTFSVRATAYAPGPHDNGKWGNKTHLGTQVRPGIIAVDPKIIPLGSRVYIELPNGQGMHAIAEDTGGAIKGNRIDIAKWTVAEAKKFGIQNAKVHVLSRGKA